MAKLTNADVLLKVSADEFIEKLGKHKIGSKLEKIPMLHLELMWENLQEFLNAPINPTLTEDERVILRNIKGYGIIKRKNNVLYLQKLTDIYVVGYFRGFDHLFQFIKERRRIFY